jgi:replicative DNA helicase
VTQNPSQFPSRPSQLGGEKGRDAAEDTLYRALPHSADVERTVLGALLLDNAFMSEAASTLEAEDFYVRAHQHVWRAMLTLYEQGSEINPVLLKEVLQQEGTLGQVGGVEGGVTFISALMHGLPHWVNMDSYIAILRDHATARRIFKASNLISADVLEGDYSAAEMRDRAQQLIYAATAEGQKSEWVAAGALVEKNLQRAAELQAAGKAVTGLATGFNDLDAMTLGLQPGNLIIVAGRPSMGKTALALALALNAGGKDAEDAGAEGRTADLPVTAVFSLEMSREEVGDRLASAEARVDGMRMRSGYLNSDDWHRLDAAHARIRDQRRIFIDDTAGITTLQIRSRARRLLAREGRLDLIVVDYLGLIGKRPGERHEGRVQEVGSYTRDLKALAKELGVPLALLCQLNRAPENRTDHRPVLADLRESGAIEQDADVVAFVFREEQYGRTEQNAGVAEIILAKQRNAPTGTVKLTFLKEFTRFENMWQG